MNSRAYAACFNAILRKKRLTFVYEDQARDVCPHVLGHSDGEEKLFVYQVGGRTREGPIPPAGDWKCLFVSKIHNLASKAGPWKTGGSHKQRHSCVKDVDIDVNPAAKQTFCWEEHLRIHEGPDRKTGPAGNKRKKRTRRRSPAT
jgi:hypothetical protein